MMVLGLIDVVNRLIEEPILLVAGFTECNFQNFPCAIGSVTLAKS